MGAGRRRRDAQTNVVVSESDSGRSQQGILGAQMNMESLCDVEEPYKTHLGRRLGRLVGLSVLDAGSEQASNLDSKVQSSPGCKT